MKKVIYLGSNVHFETLIYAVEKTTLGHLLFFLVHHKTPENSQHYNDSFKKYFGKIKIHLSGNEKFMSKLKVGMEFNWIRFVEELEKQFG